MTSALSQVDRTKWRQADAAHLVRLPPVKLTVGKLDGRQVHALNSRLDQVNSTRLFGRQNDRRQAVTLTLFTVNLTRRQIDAVELTFGTLPTLIKLLCPTNEPRSVVTVAAPP